MRGRGGDKMAHQSVVAAQLLTHDPGASACTGLSHAQFTRRLCTNCCKSDVICFLITLPQSRCFATGSLFGSFFSLRSGCDYWAEKSKLEIYVGIKVGTLYLLHFDLTKHHIGEVFFLYFLQLYIILDTGVFS